VADPSIARAEARFKQLCCLGLGGEAVVPALLEELQTIVPHFGSSVFFLGPTGELQNIYDRNPETPHVAPLYLREFYNRPEREFGMGFADGLKRRFGVQNWKEIVTVELAEWHRSDYFNLILRQLGYDDLIRLAFWDGERAVGGIMLSRAPGEREFSITDRHRLASLEGFFAHALVDGGHRDVPLVDSGHEGLIIADTDGRAVHASAEGRRLLFLASNPRVLPSPPLETVVLPAALTEICQTLERIFAEKPAQAAPVFHHRNVWGGFRFGCHWLDGADQSIKLIGITIAHEEPLPVRLTRTASNLPLSAREAQICVLLASGGTHEAIAARLGISAHTSIAHGKAIYQKLKVHSRSELLGKLLSVH
jgi:DNA-binding CsgD family transcriptional regulator